MTNTKTIDNNSVVTTKWRYIRAVANHWLHTVQFVWCALAPEILPVHNWLTQVKRSLTGNFISVIGSYSPALAAVSAFSFPLIPTWLGIQQKVTDLPPFVRWVYCFSIFKTNAFSVLRLSIACKLDKESEKTTKSLLLVLVRRIMPNAMSSAWISAVKILVLLGKRTFFTVLGVATAAAVLRPSFDPSV